MKIIVLILLIGVGVLSGNTIESKVISLSGNVKIKIPNSWTIYGIKYVDDVNGEVNNLLNNMNYKDKDIGDTLIMAKTTEGFASVKLDVLAPSMNPNTVYNISDNELVNFSDIVKQQYIKIFSLQKIKLIEYSKISKIIFDGHPSLKVKYIRSGLSNNNVVVETLMIYTSLKEYSLTLSYDANNTKLKDEINYIKESIVIPNTLLGQPIGVTH